MSSEISLDMPTWFYVPVGAENDRSQWQHIGAFPDQVTSASFGPWGLLNGTIDQNTLVGEDHSTCKQIRKQALTGATTSRYGSH
jgi:hypothetical protein